MFEEGAAAVLKRVVAGITIVVAAIGGAQAQDAPRDGFYLRAGAGLSFVGNLEQEFTHNPFLVSIVTPPSGQTVESEAGFIASAALGFDYTDGIRTELEYRYAANGVETVTPVGGFDPAIGPAPFPPRTSDGDVDGHFILSNFYYDFRSSSRFTPFIGLGVGGAFVAVEGGERDAALAYQGRAGVSYAFNNGFSADVEYVYLRTNTLRYGPDPEDFSAAGPFDAAVDGDNYQSSSVMLSIRKQF